MKQLITTLTLIIGSLAKQLQNMPILKRVENMEVILSRINAPVFRDSVFNIFDYGAIAGDTCTKAFRQAIIACNKAGGGRVLVPKGNFIIGAGYRQGDGPDRNERNLSTSPWRQRLLSGWKVCHLRFNPRG